MLNDLTHIQVLDDFKRLNRDLSLSRPWARYGKQKDYRYNNKLLASASRITVPNKFEPYIKIINRRSGFKVPTNYEFTKDEVMQQDKIALRNYGKENFDYSQLNLDNLIKASFRASQDLLFDEIGFWPTDIETSAKSFPSTSSSCYPVYGKKGDQFAQTKAIYHAYKYLTNVKPNKRHLFSQITTLFHRFQYKIDADGELVKKARPIWGIPFAISVIEGFFFRDFINKLPHELISRGMITTPLGRDLVQISEDIIKPFRSNKGKLVSMDLKNFDSRVPSFMWPLFYANVLQHYKNDPELIPHLEALMHYHCYTPYIYMGDRLQFQRQGTPSGCLITALFNTWVNRTIINYAYIERGYYYPGNRLCVLGDDNLFYLFPHTEEYIFGVYNRFGMEVNKDKTEVVDSVQDSIPFLGYIWDLQNRATQSRKWFITHLCFPSQFYTNLDIPVSLFMTYRAISVCFPLYNGYKEFMALIGFEDKIFRKLYTLYKNGEDTVIRYITQQRKYENVTFPFSLFINGTWESKTEIVSGEST